MNLQNKVINNSVVIMDLLNKVIIITSGDNGFTTVPAQIERRRSNFHLGFFGEDFTK